MTKLKFKFIVVEDDLEVCNDIKERMHVFSNWECIDLITTYDAALDRIKVNKPDLLFLDYSIRGGNTFDLLDMILTIDDYKPFIIYFTGYGSDNLFISEDVNNKYRVNIFLNKPIQEKLTGKLKEYIKEAEKWINQHCESQIWIETVNKVKLKINLETVFCVSQSENNPRYKVVHFTNGTELEIKSSWKKCETIAIKHNIDYCFTNARYTLINKAFISKIQKPYVWLNKGQLKVEVTKEKWKDIY